MQSAQIWANLAVKDIERTAAFYSKLGFASNMSRPSSDLTSFKFADNGFVIHFFKQEKLESAMNGKTANLKNGNEVMFSLAARTEDEVRTAAKNAEDAGGTIFRQPEVDENGYFYCGFADPDGHMFNVLLVTPGM